MEGLGPPFRGPPFRDPFANQMSACGHPRSSSRVDDKKHASKLCDGLPEEWSTHLSSLCCAWKIGNSHKVDFIDWYQPGVYCLKCLKRRWVYIRCNNWQLAQLINYGQLGLSEYTLAIKKGRLNLILPPPLYTYSTNGKHIRDSCWCLGIISIPAPTSSKYGGQKEF